MFAGSEEGSHQNPEEVRDVVKHTGMRMSPKQKGRNVIVTRANEAALRKLILPVGLLMCSS